MEPLKVTGTKAGRDKVGTAGGPPEGGVDDDLDDDYDDQPFDTPGDDEEDGSEYKDMFPDDKPDPVRRDIAPRVVVGADILEAVERLVQDRVNKRIEEFKRVLEGGA